MRATIVEAFCEHCDAFINSIRKLIAAWHMTLDAYLSVPAREFAVAAVAAWRQVPAPKAVRATAARCDRNRP